MNFNRCRYGYRREQKFFKIELVCPRESLKTISQLILQWKIKKNYKILLLFYVTHFTTWYLVIYFDWKFLEMSNIMSFSLTFYYKAMESDKVVTVTRVLKQISHLEHRSLNPQQWELRYSCMAYWYDKWNNIMQCHFLTLSKLNNIIRDLTKVPYS